MRKRTVLRSVIAIIVGVALLGPVAAMAQGTSEGQTGLTVIGYGEASAPADTATVQFLVGMESFGPPQAPDPNATPGASERERIAPVVSSLADAGVSEDAIETILGPYVSESLAYGGPAIALVRIELADPSSERVTEIIDAATLGAAQERLIVSRVSVTYGVEDCAALEREAREQAIADARVQANVQAELLDVTLGELSGARDMPYGIEPSLGLYGPVSSSAGCAPFDTPATELLAYGSPSFDPNVEPVVTVRAQVELTYEMSVNAEATPAA